MKYRLTAYGVMCLLVSVLLAGPAVASVFSDTAWTRVYSGSPGGADCAVAIEVDAAGNVYVAGSSVGTGTGFDYVTLKYDELGNLL